MLCQLGEEGAAERMRGFSDYTMAKRVAGETEVGENKRGEEGGGGKGMKGEEEGEQEQRRR
eukprot:213047-Hanusia_phi.AAC.1